MEDRFSRRMTLLRRRPDIAPAAFSEHWAGPHALIARRYPGLLKYVQNHVEQRLDPAPVDSFQCHGMAELWFADRAAIATAQGSSTAQALIEDEPRFLDGVTGMLLGTATLDDGEGGIKIIVLGRGGTGAPDTGPADAFAVSRARVMETWSRPALWSVPEPPDTVLVARFSSAAAASAALDPAAWPALSGLSVWHAYQVREIRVV